MDRVSWDGAFSRIMEENKGNLYAICKLCTDLFEENGETAREGFQYFLTQVPLPRYNPGEFPEELLDVAEDEIDTPTQNRICEMEYQIVKELIFQDVEEETFYAEIWQRISDKLLVSDKYQKSFFLFRMWLDPRIPYYRLGLGISMDGETYATHVKQLALPYKKMVFAMNAGYPKRTQKVSVLMDIAEEIPDREQRVVFWALTLGRLEKQVTDLKQQIQKLKALSGADDMAMG